MNCPNLCCWAFLTIVVVEGINQIATSELIQLSKQELFDCDQTYNFNCNGGLMDYAFQFIIGNSGIDSKTDYSYNGTDDYCYPARKIAKVLSIGVQHPLFPSFLFRTKSLHGCYSVPEIALSARNNDS